MAKRIVDEEMKFDIIINGDNARKELYDLEKSTRRLTEENKALGLQKKLLEKQGKQETEEYKTLTKAIRDNNKEIKESKAKMAELQNQIGLTGLTMAQLQSKSTQLKLALRNLVPGSEDHQRYKKELQEVTDRINELNGKAKQSKLSLSSMADGFNKYAAMGASFLAMLTGVVLSLQKMIDFNAKLSDAQTNVQKTTGMTKREVDELTKSFGLLKTRTGRIDLLGIAETGGKLGIAKNEIADFVKVMDKSAVALGDAFEGPPEVVAEKLGRIKGLYEDLKNVGVEEAFERVGSALNDLGAAGTASEGNVSEFVTRVGTIPEALRPSIQEALGLGAAFEESGIKAEVAGNNYGKFISIASRDIDAFAHVMQRPRKELEQLINTNPTEFFFQFASAIKGLDATQLSQVLDYLKLNDNEVKQVLGAASSNVDLFRDKIKLASQSMADATSLTVEYDLKNNNLAATLERLKKKVIGWFTSDGLVSFLTAAVDRFAKLIGAIEDSDGSMTGLRNTLVFTAKVLAIIIASMLSYAAAAQLTTLWSNSLGKAVSFSNIMFRIQYAQLVIQESATKALALAKALLSLNIGRVKVAYQALQTAMGMNPLGALLAVVGAVVAAFVAFRSEADKANQAIKAQAEVQQLVNDQTGKTKTKITELVAIMKDENATRDQKKKALQDLKKIGQGYLETLTAENILTAEGTRLIDRYVKSIDQLAKAKAMVDVKSKLEAQKLESDNKILALSLEKKANKNEGYAGGGDDGKYFGLIGDRNKKEIQLEIDEEKKNREAINNQLSALDNSKKQEIDRLRNSIHSRTVLLKNAKKDSAQYKTLIQDIRSDENALDTLLGLSATNAEDSSGTGKGVIVPDKEKEKAGEKAEKEAERLRKERKDKLKKELEEINELERKGIDERLALMLDGHDKEEAQENAFHQQRLKELQAQLISDADIEAAGKKAQNMKLSAEERDYWSRQQQAWMEKNRHLDNLIETEHMRHQLKISAITDSATRKRMEEIQSGWDREAILREAGFNEELAALGNNEKAKEQLRKDYDAQELEIQEEHLREMLAEYQDILDDKNQGIDLSLLTPEQVREIEDQVANLKLKISELVKARADLNGKNTESTADAFAQAFGDADVLGFSADQWGRTFDSLDTLADKLMATKMVIGALQNIWGAYNQYLNANEDAQLRTYEKNTEAKKKKLKWQLDNGYISQTKYNQMVEQMDADLDKKKAETEYKQAKRQKVMAAINIMMNTAQAIMGIWAQVPKFDFGATAGILTGVVAALGAVQLATVMKSPLPAQGYELGLYQDVQREQDGKIFRAQFGGSTKTGMVNKPTFFLAGEAGPEMVIDRDAYRQISPETKSMLWNELRRIKGFEKGYYNPEQSRYEVPAVDTAPSYPSQDYIPLLIATLQKTNEVMDNIYNDGLVAWLTRDPREMKKLQGELDKIRNSKDKAKV